jgi:ATP-dependent Clp protease, protease subunit
LSIPKSITKFSPVSARSSGKKGELDIFGPIGDSWFEDSVTLKAFKAELDKVKDAEEIVININSPGGDVFTGVSIYNLLKQHKAKKVVKIQALAASIASIIALAGDEIEMGEGSLYMIHLPFTFTMGNREELDKTIDRLLDIEEQMINIYTKKTKKPRHEIKQMLEKETWLDGEEAIAEGFADRTLGDTMPIAASILDKATWFNKKPDSIKTSEQVARQKALDLKSKVEAFIARGKKA